MTRQKMIKKLEEIKEKIDWDSDDELTNYARERAYVCIQQAIEFLSENKEYQKMTEQEAISGRIKQYPLAKDLRSSSVQRSFGSSEIRLRVDVKGLRSN